MVKKENNYQNRLGKNLNFKDGERELTISISNKYNGYDRAFMMIPMQWIKELGIEKEIKNVVAVCKDGKIEIRKNNKKSED